MLFNSFNFILIFLPITIIGWYALNHFKLYKTAELFITAMSFIFYGLFSVKFLAVLIFSIVGSYLISILVKISKLKASFLITISVIFHLFILFLFKYYDFFAESVNSLFGSTIPLYTLLMPIGISFYTFQQLSFLIDRCKGEAPAYSFLDYTCYVAFFPKLIEGPIARHDEIIPQFNDVSKRRFDSDGFSRGICMFIMGLGKKVLLADTLSLVTSYGFEQTYYLDTITVILVMLAYTFEIYFDFSGYCDMACGISKMLGIDLPINFNSPYKAYTIKNLWKRWHITLTRFFVKYLYIPLGGNRRGKLITVANVLLVFILSGLWHGAGWTYICWGLMQGLLVVWDDLGIVVVKDENGNVPSSHEFLLRDKPLLAVPNFIGHIFTFGTFVISLIFFRSEDMAHAFGMFRRLFYFTWPGFLYRASSKLDVAETYVFGEAIGIAAPSLTNAFYLVVLVLLILVSFFIITRKNTMEIALSPKALTKGRAIFLAIIFIWSFMSLSNVSTFIYFKY